METKIKSINTQLDLNKSANCSPINNIFSNVKIRITGNLNEKDLNELYKCNLCNSCHMAGFNQGARTRAVNKSLEMPHVATIRQNINDYGNPYGIDDVRKGDNKERMETVLFRGCTSSYKASKTLKSAKSLLKRENITYGLIDNETCCGNILFNLGDNEAGLEVVKKNVEKFKAVGVKRIITICPGCYNAFNKYYKEYDGFNPEIVLAVDLLDELRVSGEFEIQDPCHAKEKGSVVRKILQDSENRSLNQCCGAGGGVMAHDEQTAALRAIKAVENSPKKIVTYCPFCYLNLSSVSPDEVIDIYTLLNELLLHRL
jgi:Fe-S oxidoreductase